MRLSLRPRCDQTYQKNIRALLDFTTLQPYIYNDQLIIVKNDSGTQQMVIYLGYEEHQ